jgi:HSP20 family protein
MSTEKERFYRRLPLRPFREMEEMRRRFDDDVARPLMRAIWERIPEEQRGWAPAIDIFEKGEDFIVKAELPGMKQEDIELAVSGDKLTVKGDKRTESGVQDENYHRAEIEYGPYYRSVTLPEDVDTKNVEATYENGVLRVTLHKAAGAKAKKISIQVKKGTE